MKIDREKVLIGLLIVTALIVVGYKFMYEPLYEHRDNLQDTLASLGSYNTNVETMENNEVVVKKQLEDLDNKIADLKSAEDTESINIQDFLLYLSTKTKEYDVDIQKFKDLGVEEENGIWRTTFDIELYGNVDDLIKVNESINNLSVANNTTSISFRQSGDVKYLERYHKGIVELGWYDRDEDEDKDDDVKVESVEIPSQPKVSIEEEVITVMEEEVVTVMEEETVTVMEEQVITIDEEDVVENEPSNIQDQLEILLGIDGVEKKTSGPKTKVVMNPVTKVIEKPVTKVIEKPVTKVVQKQVVHEPENLHNNLPVSKDNNINELGVDFRSSKMHLDFTIEFTMFTDPEYTYNYKELYNSNNKSDIKIYIVDDNGTELSDKVILDKIKSESEYLENEIERVMGVLSKESVSYEIELKEYLNYLIGKR